MADADDHARLMNEIRAGRLAGVALAAIKDPHLRLLEAARRAGCEVVSIKDLAAELGKSVRTLRRWNKRSDAPRRVRRGKKHVYRREDVVRWLELADGPLKGEDER